VEPAFEAMTFSTGGKSDQLLEMLWLRDPTEVSRPCRESGPRIKLVL
jgi:hypothetical protein